MIFYDYYGDVPLEKLEDFARGNELGRLLTVGTDGLPHIGLYPFVYTRGLIEIHLNRADEQLVDLASRPRCVFELDEVLGVIPSYWIDPDDAVKATAYHQSVLFECQASVSNDAAALAEQQKRLLARYQPEVRADLVRELRKRGRRNDGRAADALQWTIDQDAER